MNPRRCCFIVWLVIFAVFPLATCGTPKGAVIDDVNPIEDLYVGVIFDEAASPPVDVKVGISQQCVVLDSIRVDYGDGGGWVSVEAPARGSLIELMHLYVCCGEYTVSVKAVGTETGRLLTDSVTFRIGPIES